MTARTFGRLPGDLASYSLNDADGAVRLCRAAPAVAMDVETGSARSDSRWTVKAFSVSDTATSYVLDPTTHADAIRECIGVARRAVFHNGAYDVPILVQAGLMSVADIAKVDDTMIMGRIAWPDSVANSNTLGALADRVLGGAYSNLKSSLESGFKAVNPSLSKSAMFDLLGIADPAYVAYSAFDVLTTMRVYNAMPSVLAERLNPALPSFRPADAGYINEREQTVNRLLLRRSAVGIDFDDDAAESITLDLMHEAAISRKVLQSYGIDPDIGGAAIKRQLVKALAERGELPANWPRLKNGAPTTARGWMERLEDNEVAQAADSMARAERFVHDYRGGSAGLSYRGRIHPQVSVQAAVTGRMSYSNPALQQYPPAVRGMFRFDHPITSFDWSSIEPVVIGNLAGAHEWIQGFEAGGDLYQPIADQAGVLRAQAKTVLLALLYGQGATSLAFRLKVTVDDARSLQRAVRDGMPEVSKVMRMVSGYGEQYGAIQTISGRIVTLPKDPRTGNKRFMGYKGTNYLVQGSAYDLLAEAIYAMHLEGLGDALCLAIHDELVVDTEVASDVERIMRTPPPALIEAAGRVPVLRVGRTDLGHHWKAKA